MTETPYSNPYHKLVLKLDPSWKGEKPPRA